MTQPADPVRMLLIGAGGITQAHLPAFERHPDKLRLVGVCDPSEKATAAVSERLESKEKVEQFTDYEAAIESLGDRIDGALITTPHFLHFPQAMACMKAGIPVLIEKPVTCTLDEFRELQATQSVTGTFAIAGQMQRFGQEENWIRGWLNSSSFGAPRLFNLDIYQNIEGYISDKPDAWILDKRLAGGGVVISVAVHILDLIRYWFDDDFVEVSAHGRMDAPFKNGAESTCVAILKTRRGMVGTLNCCYTVARTPYSQRSLIFGTQGTLAQHMDTIGGGYAGKYFISSNNGQPSPEWNMMYSGFESVQNRMSAEPGYTENPFPGLFVDQLLAFAEAVRTGQPYENTLSRNFNTIAVIDAIARSLAEEKPVHIATS